MFIIFMLIHPALTIRIEIFVIMLKVNAGLAGAKVRAPIFQTWTAVWTRPAVAAWCLGDLCKQGGKKPAHSNQVYKTTIK